jgi:CheY-like chemotaxis protein
MAKPSEPIGLLLSDDLMFSSRITGVARALGLNVKAARTVDALLEMARQHPPRCVIVDLANPGLVPADFLRDLRSGGGPLTRVVAYGSHVDAESLRAARAAGCDPVLPRSKFVEELPTALPDWFGGPKSPMESVDGRPRLG